MKEPGLALVSFAAAPSFLSRTILAQTSGNSHSARPIIIAIFQRGAADGLSMVVPFGDKNYSGARPALAIAEPKSSVANTGLDLDGFFAVFAEVAARHLGARDMKSIFPGYTPNPASFLGFIRE